MVHIIQWLPEVASRQLLPSALCVIDAVLGAIGFYTLVASSVAERMREFGIPQALGAESRRVMGLVFCQTGAVTAIGAGVSHHGGVAGGPGPFSPLSLTI
jgi:ABC-type antimicrobial peptide transport system permease subunit